MSLLSKYEQVQNIFDAAMTSFLKNDSFLWCELCKDGYFKECPQHSSIIFDEGVYNDSKHSIPTGVIFGPYEGRFLCPDDVDDADIDHTDTESSSETKKTSTHPLSSFSLKKPSFKVTDIKSGAFLGAIAPHNSDNWLPLLRATTLESDSNIIPFQLKDFLFYKVKKDVHPGQELITVYPPVKRENSSLSSLESSLSYNCSSCSHSFELKRQLLSHRESEHFDSSSFSLDSSSSQGVLKIKKKGSQRAFYSCSLCSKGFSLKGSLKAHTESSHSKIPIKCSLCQKTFTLKGSLKTHIETVHIRSFHPCPKCSKSFTLKGSLTTHILNVHEKIVHPCPYCSRSFSQKGNLTTHIRIAHDLSGFRSECS